MRKQTEDKAPAFQTAEEEKKYWESRGPLAEGHRGKWNKPSPKQTRASFLTVRLTGEELTLLRDVAAKSYLSPSTFARMAIMSAVNEQMLRFSMQKRAEEDLRRTLVAEKRRPFNKTPADRQG